MISSYIIKNQFNLFVFLGVTWIKKTACMFDVFYASRAGLLMEFVLHEAYSLQNNQVWC